MVSELSPIPLQRTMIVVDIEGSTRRNNSATAVLRHDLYELFEAALLDCDITEELRDPFTDRGDGLMAFVHAVDQVPKTAMLTKFIPVLTRLIGEHGARRPERKFRIRAAMHAGDVHFDLRGPFGEDVTLTTRLVDAPELKAALAETEAPLVLAVSEQLHRSVIRHGYEGIDEDRFEQTIELDIGGRRVPGWVQLPEPRVPGKAIPLRDRVSRAKPGARFPAVRTPLPRRLRRDVPDPRDPTGNDPGARRRISS
ncbi:hypothetical protein [Amycolatopsis albispora]|uniref:Guanylate cyclase domain-containing protein n=1 Tax=Amycolatopsis albispora TaxID=1804986 RepID=A0A344L481_9PSEU|nr:hypothetical protein [Amycolatopsis albispora]AXB42855.1 hypothetical protein A4R43_10165 [Amycolatopsis albispora]